MKFQDIATFSGNILTFLGLPALIFFNFSSFLFFLNEWKIPFICGSVVILITTLIYHRKKRRYPNKSSCFSLLVLFFAMGGAVFYQPYPEFAQISISGFYNEKDGGGTVVIQMKMLMTSLTRWRRRGKGPHLKRILHSNLYPRLRLRTGNFRHCF